MDSLFWLCGAAFSGLLLCYWLWSCSIAASDLGQLAERTVLSMRTNPDEWRDSSHAFNVGVTHSGGTVAAFNPVTGTAFIGFDKKTEAEIGGLPARRLKHAVKELLRRKRSDAASRALRE